MFEQQSSAVSIAKEGSNMFYSVFNQETQKALPGKHHVYLSVCHLNRLRTHQETPGLGTLYCSKAYLQPTQQPTFSTMAIQPATPRSAPSRPRLAPWLTQ
eukprot:1150202-Pelagomonas_calceolata.AAC.1